MNLVELTKESLEQEIAKNGIVVLSCWAPGCGPCREFTPVFIRVAASFPTITFGRLNTEAERTASEALGVTHVPCLLIFRERVLLYRQTGLLKETSVESLIREALSLDMDVVRAELSSDQSPAPMKEN